MRGSQRNCKEEFLEETAGKNIFCAEIVKGDEYTDEADKIAAHLRIGYSAKDMEEFLQKIDFDYYSGFGTQEVFGTIWYDDDTWSERYEYDGAEWWVYKSSPAIPFECIRNNI